VSDELVRLATGLFTQVPERQHRVLLAMLERLAAEQYRRWADEVGDEHRVGMLECSAREEEVGRLVETGLEDAAGTARELGERFPELGARYAALLEGRSLREQFAIQAAGERAGAELLRSFEMPDVAELEDDNARFLDRVSQELPS
jgi:hypothetical protein